ncbi:glycosyltransferase [Commensalibacter sp. M0357]|uniref:glycosyltransferase family 2 protein n=1 Tax=unclassified Commensalibacter TaxID=2630218 RepID=UPI0018DE1DFB|nr:MULTISPECIES: glycosyltransferase [unclassified Commensalibacter]MBI0074706.1 glycosyltransferase [Commensalibacter sp. M0357]MBI0084547.1 glycosyltransferase [Commensalibacter sp. M0355]
MHVLQNLLFNNHLSDISEKLYFDIQKGGIQPLSENDGIILEKNSRISFGTYFNYFSLNTWRKYCQLKDLHFQLQGKGEFVLRFWLTDKNYQPSSSKRVIEKQVYLNKDQNCFCIDCSFLLKKQGILHFTIDTKGECFIQGGSFCTKTDPVNYIKLGIVITHYNRKKYLIPAIRRIETQLLSNESFKNNIDLIIVDNSRDVSSEEAGEAIVISNLNYGGSGGFTRGLLYLKDRHYTHCLFMDDDASCEIESIIKTFRLLQYSVVERLGIAGTMLYEKESTIIHEKGAQYKPLSLIQLYCGLDISKFETIIATDLDKKKIEYGAWWHFAFKIEDVNYFPFPFFVKGDDMLFGLMNHFNIITVNGICVFGEDFRYKDGPLPRYLSVRANFALALIYSDCSLWIYVWRYIRWIFISILTYRYASARATSIALQHVMRGPEFWTRYLSLTDIYPAISNVLSEEKMDDVDIDQLKPSIRQVRFPILKKIIIIMTFNGFFLPDFFIRDRLILSKKEIKHFPYEIFLERNILYYSSEYNKGYVAIYNKKKFFSELFLGLKLMIQFVVRFKKLKREYRQVVPKIMTEKFWRKVYQFKR